MEGARRKQKQTGESSRNLDQNLKEKFKKCYKTPRQEYHAVKKHKNPVNYTDNLEQEFVHFIFYLIKKRLFVFNRKKLKL